MLDRPLEQDTAHIGAGEVLGGGCPGGTAVVWFYLKGVLTTNRLSYYRAVFSL
jgi:hypothetical protein